LNCNDYTLTAKAKTDLTVLKLPYFKLYQLRQKYNKLDDVLSDYEEYLDENSPPLCDYKMNISEDHYIEPIQRLKNGVKRLMSIIRSHRTISITDLIKNLKAELRGDKKKKDERREKLLTQSNLNSEQRNEQSISILNEKVEKLTNMVSQQNATIDVLKNEVLSKLNEIQSKRNLISSRPTVFAIRFRNEVRRREKL